MRWVLILVVSCGTAAAQFKPLTAPNDKDFCGGTTACTTPTVNTTGAKLIAVGCSIHNSSATCAVTSSFSASWIAGPTFADGADGNLSIFYAISPATSASATVTCTASSSSSVNCLGFNFSLASGVPIFDTSAIANTAGTPASSLAAGTLTLAATTDVVVTFWTDQDVVVNTMLPSASFILGMEPTITNNFIAGAYTAATRIDPCGQGTCMTSNSVPSPYTISASTQQNPAFFSFDGLYDSQSWLGLNSGVDWLCVDLGSAKVVNAYGIVNTQDTPTRSPKDFTFNGSNAGCNTSLTTLDTESSVTDWGGGAGGGSNYVFSWPLANTTAYRYYQVSTTTNNGAGAFTGFSEEYLYQYAALGSTSITPTWSVCSGTGCASNTAMVVGAVAFKFSSGTGTQQIGGFLVGP